MNFEMEYAPEQQRFRKEVQDFLKENVPQGLMTTGAREAISFEQYRMQRELGRKLGARGWLYPTDPPEYGGGGMSMAEAIILEAEAHELGLTLPPYYDLGGEMAAPSILAYGTEEQKRQFLPPIFTGQVRTWHLVAEPDTGSDWANVQTRAIRDGDDYVISGQKVFAGSDHGADRFWMIAVTNPDASRHENVSWFMVDAHLPGITVQPLDLLAAGHEGGASAGVKNTVTFDQVRVPLFSLIGGENNGFQVMTSYLETALPKYGYAVSSPLWDRLIEYCKTHKLDGRPLNEDEDVRDLLIEIFIDLEITRLFSLHSLSRALAKQPRSYEDAQAIAYRKASDLRIAGLIQKILGYYALTTDVEHGAAEGHFEQQQRTALADLATGGTIEIQKSIMARRLGIGRTTRDDVDVVV